ncbi:hypothetical protein D3C81_2167230 [compost metagenome]
MLLRLIVTSVVPSGLLVKTEGTKDSLPVAGSNDTAVELSELSTPGAVRVRFT